MRLVFKVIRILFYLTHFFFMFWMTLFSVVIFFNFHQKDQTDFLKTVFILDFFGLINSFLNIWAVVKEDILLLLLSGFIYLLLILMQFVFIIRTIRSYTFIWFFSLLWTIIICLMFSNGHCKYFEIFLRIKS